MEMKSIIGLDLGTNSIGGSFVRIPKNIDEFGKGGKIEWLGSRIIPVDGDYLQKFKSGGQAETKAAARRNKRGSRRLKHRYKLRRTRLIKVFKILGWLDDSFPEDFKKEIALDESFKFNISDYLPFSDETISEATEQLGVKNKRNKNNKIIIPEDWIIYYLRKKALTSKITIAELTRIIYMMNQRRGFKSSRKDLKETSILNYKEFGKIKEAINNGKIDNYKNGNGEAIETKFVAITKIKTVEKDGDEKDKKGNFSFKITAEDKRLEPWIERRKKTPEWIGKEFNLVVTQKIDKAGKFTQNKPQVPTEDDWELNMVALDNQISDKTPGAFFWNKLVSDKNYKIRQLAVRREKYKNELETIWQKQLELRKTENTENELLNRNKLEEIATTLYKHNKVKQKELIENGLLHIISNDIIYYQRELKSQKNSVGECQYEKHKGIDGEIYGIKCASKSSPEFQEFRIWQDIHNIRIFEKEQKDGRILKIDVDVTNKFINQTAKEKLFELFDSSKEVTELNVFEALNKLLVVKILGQEHYRINLFSNRDKLKGNETKELFRKVFRKFNYKEEGEKLLQNKTTLRKLWHINYSISSSNLERSIKGIKTALTKFNLPSEIIDAFSKLPEPKKEYAAYSIKAINKLLPLMRVGKYWNWDNFHSETKERIKEILLKGWDIELPLNAKKFLKGKNVKTENDFNEFPTYMACYVAYARHSEIENKDPYNLDKIKSLDIMKLVPNNSLRNPIVEQVIRETLFLVKDLCNEYGQPDEIHIELGRDLKKNAVEKERISRKNAKNLEEKVQIRKLLNELMNNEFEYFNEEGEKINNSFVVKPNPENPRDIEKFRIYKSCGTFSVNEDKENWDNLFKKGKKEKIPTEAEIKKYTLWLSQKCRSPYTGKIISLGKLFTEEYEVEHIIPRKKLKYDAFDNLVICERGVNKLKRSELAMSFISQNSGATLSYEGKNYKLHAIEDYILHCKNTFNGRKLKNLLAIDIPENFIERQINDTRYITRKVSELLYPMAKEKNGLVFTIGNITNDLKREWGLNGVWKDILKPRFERLEQITGEQMIVTDRNDKNKFHFNVSEQPDFKEKRIDHRHHALDALIIASTTREHIRYLNSLNAVDTDEELRNVKRALVKGKIRDFKLPWEAFTKDAKEKLDETIVTFKSNKKVVSKPFNKYKKWLQNENGIWEKKECFQVSNKRWMAVRKSLFKEPQGIVWIKEKRKVTVLEAFKIQINRMKVENDSERRKIARYVYDQLARPIIKNIIERIGIDLVDTESLLKEISNYLKKNSKRVETDRYKKNGKPEYITIYSIGDLEYETIEIAEFIEYAAKRVKLDNTFTHDKINKIPYAKAGNSPLAEILHEHLKSYKDNPSEAFIGEGIEALTKKTGRRVDKVTIYEKKSPEDKFGNKYVEVDKGANAFFIIHENEKTKERTEMYSLATHKAIERIIQGKEIAERKEGYKTIILSPDDLVYVPAKEERINLGNINWSNKEYISKRIYRMVSCSGKECHFIPHRIATPILKTAELGANNKSEKAWDGQVEYASKGNGKSTRTDSGTRIKDVCIQVIIDRLGNIRPVK